MKQAKKSMKLRPMTAKALGSAYSIDKIGSKWTYSNPLLPIMATK